MINKGSARIYPKLDRLTDKTAGLKERPEDEIYYRPGTILLVGDTAEDPVHVGFTLGETTQICGRTCYTIGKKEIWDFKR